jgi:hypothetical protein
MLKEPFLKFEGYAVNEWMQLTFENYLIHGFEPGSFTTAVLANDLYEACGRADFQNRTSLGDIGRWVYQNCPPQSRGSYEAVRDWCADRDGCRTAYAEPFLKARMWSKLKQV